MKKIITKTTKNLQKIVKSLKAPSKTVMLPMGMIQKTQESRVKRWLRVSILSREKCEDLHDKNHNGV